MARATPTWSAKSTVCPTSTPRATIRPTRKPYDKRRRQRQPTHGLEPADARHAGLLPRHHGHDLDVWQRHDSGINMAFCDGSVHQISYTIDSHIPAALRPQNGDRLHTSRPSAAAQPIRRAFINVWPIAKTAGRLTRVRSNGSVAIWAKFVLLLITRPASGGGWGHVGGGRPACPTAWASGWCRPGSCRSSPPPAGLRSTAAIARRSFFSCRSR